MNRNGIIQHIELWKKKLGSASAVAKKVGISDATMSQLLSGKYGAEEQQILSRIAVALEYKDRDWQIVRTIANYKQIKKVVTDAKNESMWLSISNPAGSGKTGTLEDIFNQDETGSVYFVQCEEWTGQQFLKEVVRKTLGENALKGAYKSITELIELISDYFNERQFSKPVLMIDEADKLRPAALRTLIPLFNKTEDRLGVVMCGTENLRKEIERGVRLHKKGFDEIHSRIGRVFLDLRGANEKEVYAICEANGITDLLHQQQIWNELETEHYTTEKLTKKRNEKGVVTEVIDHFMEDFRRLKRIIKRERLKYGN